MILSDARFATYNPVKIQFNYQNLFTHPRNKSKLKNTKTSNRLSLNSMLGLLNFLYWYDHWFFDKKKNWNFTCLIPTTFPLPVVVRESAPRITPSAYSNPMMVVYTNQEYWKYKFVQRLQNKRRWTDFQFQNNFSIDQRCWKMIINAIFFVELDANGIFDCSLIDQRASKRIVNALFSIEYDANEFLIY